MHIGFSWENLRERAHLEDPGIEIDVREVRSSYEVDRCGSRLKQVAGSCGGGNEPSSSIKCTKFLNYLRTC